MKKLGTRNYLLISQGVKMCGTYDPAEIRGVFEEELFEHEVDTIIGFLAWVHADEKNRCFGHGNYEARFEEYLKHLKTILAKSKEDLLKAASLGARAFKNDKPCVPAWDKDLLDMMEGKSITEGAVLTEAWSKAWHDIKHANEFKIPG